MSEVSLVSKEIDVKPNINTEVDRKPIIPDDDDDDPIAIVTRERVELLRRERKTVLENCRLKTSKLDMEEKLVRMEEENRRLRLASGINVKQEGIVKQEPRDIKPIIPTSGISGVEGPSSSMTRGDTADDQISVDGDDEDVVFVSAKWATTRAVPLALPLPTPPVASITHPNEPKASTSNDVVGGQVTSTKVKKRKKSRRLLEVKRAKAREPSDAALRILRKAKKWAGSQRKPESSDSSDSSDSSESSSESHSGSELISGPNNDSSRNSSSVNRAPPDTSFTHGKSSTQIRETKSKSQDGSEQESEPPKKEPSKGRDRNEKKVAAKRFQVSSSETEDDNDSVIVNRQSSKKRDREEKKIFTHKPKKSRSESKSDNDDDDESDSDGDLTTSCNLYVGARLRVLSVDAIGHRLSRAYRRHGLTKTTIQVLERWWPKTKVTTVHSFDKRHSYLLLHAVHVWWSRLLGIISEEGYKWPGGMGATSEWMLSRVREIVLQKEAAAERAERDMKTEGGSISTKAVIHLVD